MTSFFIGLKCCFIRYLTASMLGLILTAAFGVVSAEVVEVEIPIRVGDLISVTVVEDPELFYHGEVDASGYIRLPYLGEYKVIGLTERECASRIKELLEEDMYNRATVAVRIIKRAPGIVYVYGAVKSPGPVSLPELGHMTILQAISHVDGVTAWASPKEATVNRQNPITQKREKIQVNLISAFREIGGPDDVQLLADDVIFVPAANVELSQVLSNEPYEIIVVGQVSTPGIVSFAPGELRTFMRAIFKAGNFTRFAKKKAVRLIRYGTDTENDREVRTINAARIIDEGFLEDDFELLPGDMIIVDEKRINF